MALAFAVSVVVAGVTLGSLGAGHRGTIVGLQLTARWSYCLFLPAYIGGALALLFGSAFLPLARQGRNLGLAFASAHFTHACLVAWLYYISSRPPVSTFSAIYFGIALLLTYLLALFSIPGLSARMPALLWWVLLTFGMDYIALAFLRDFLSQHPFGGSLEHEIAYLPFVVLGLLAALVRLAAYAKRLHRKWLAPQPAG